MKYDHNQICTKDNEVEVGKDYDYKEDSSIFRVRVVKEESDKEGIGFKLEILEGPEKGTSFSCWAANGKYAYSGMWRLYDLNTYVNVAELRKAAQ